MHNCLDDVWKIEAIAYPQARMEHLFEVVGNGIIKLVQRWTSDINVWAVGDSNENIDFLVTCKRACDKWAKTCEQLTTLYWPNYSGHKWTGPKYSPGDLISFAEHLGQVWTRKKASITVGFAVVTRVRFCVLDHIDTVREQSDGEIADRQRTRETEDERKFEIVHR